MGTTTQPRTSQSTNARGSAPAPARREPGEREAQYDLLTATLIGVFVGAGAALLIRGAPKLARPIAEMRRRRRGGPMRRGARWVRERGEELRDVVSPDEIRDRIGDAVDAAREAVSDTVESELKDLRKAIRRQRRRLGL